MSWGSRRAGFILGAPLATRLGAGFIPFRKPGKLPWESVAEKYALEYGEDSLHAHRDACKAGDRVLIADDVLATGGTAAAAGRLVRGLGAELLGWTFLLEIGVLNGRERLSGARAGGAGERVSVGKAGKAGRAGGRVIVPLMLLLPGALPGAGTELVPPAHTHRQPAGAGRSRHGRRSAARLTTQARASALFIDPRNGTRFVLQRDFMTGNGPIGDYAVEPTGRYGVGPRTLVRMDCAIGRPLGGVPR